jgi:hypothetical protein
MTDPTNLSAEVNGAKWTAPYTSFTTLIRLLDRMKEEGGSPARLDRSYLSNLPGGAQTIFLASGKALGLIEDNGAPTAELDALIAASEEDRKRIVRGMVEHFYAGPLDLGPRATQAMLEDWFREQNVSGSTLRKAIGFFLNATKFADMTVSPNFRLPKALPSNGGRKRTTRRSEPDLQEEEQPETNPTRSDLPTLIVGLVERLPADGETWTAEEADQWLAIARLTLPFVYQFSFPDSKGG